MKVMRCDAECLHFLLGDFDAAPVRSAIQTRLDCQSRLCGGTSDETDDGAVVRQRSASPIVLECDV